MKRHFRSHHLFLSMISILLLLSLTSCAATNSESQSGHAKGNSSATDNNASTSSESTETSESTSKTDDGNFSTSPLYSQYRLTYTDATGYSLPYCLYLPKKEAFPEDSEKTSYPLVLFLHGAGERGTDNELQNNDTGIVPRLTDETFYAAHPCILVTPQCPADAQWVNTPWTEGSYSIEETPISPALSAANELLDDICAQYPADTSRLYITGVSMGGYGAWDLLPGPFCRGHHSVRSRGSFSGRRHRPHSPAPVPRRKGHRGARIRQPGNVPGAAGCRSKRCPISRIPRHWPLDLAQCLG